MTTKPCDFFGGADPRSPVVNTNILINGDEAVNQRGVTDWVSVTIGQYGFDRWQKIDASTKRQPVEDKNYKPDTVYTLSGEGVTTKQVASPASGHWDNTDLDVPIDAINIKLEEGEIATPFVADEYSVNYLKCCRYYWWGSESGQSGLKYASWAYNWDGVSNTFPVQMRITPTMAVTSQPIVGSCSLGAFTQNVWGWALKATTTTATHYDFRSGRYSADAEI